MHTIEQIKHLLKESKITYGELSERSGIPEGTLKNIFSYRNRNPRIDTMRAIEEALGIEQSDEVFAIPGFMPIQTVKVPLVGTIACGTPILAVENIEEYIDMDKSVRADFCLRCKGDSMINARIFDGDIVYIRKQADVNNGEIAAVLIDGESTLKRVFKYEDKIELRPENPLYKSIYIMPGEDVRIVGVAVAFLSAVR